MRSFLETYFDEAVGFRRLSLSPKVKRTVRYLRSRGAETDRLWEDGWTATQFASDFGNEPLVKLLVEDPGLAGDVKLLKDRIQNLEGNIIKINSQETQCRRAWEASQRVGKLSVKGNDERNAKEKKFKKEVHKLKRQRESSMRDLERAKTELHYLQPAPLKMPPEWPVKSKRQMVELADSDEDTSVQSEEMPSERPAKTLREMLGLPEPDREDEKTRKDEQPASWLRVPVPFIVSFGVAYFLHASFKSRK